MLEGSKCGALKRNTFDIVSGAAPTGRGKLDNKITRRSFETLTFDSDSEDEEVKTASKVNQEFLKTQDHSESNSSSRYR